MIQLSATKASRSIQKAKLDRVVRSAQLHLRAPNLFSCLVTIPSTNHEARGTSSKLSLCLFLCLCAFDDSQYSDPSSFVCMFTRRLFSLQRSFVQQLSVASRNPTLATTIRRAHRHVRLPPSDPIRVLFPFIDT